MKILDLLANRRDEAYALHERHLNMQMVRVLRTIGFDVRYTRATGAYLYDAEGHCYLDLLSGWGVFALGRNHPQVVAALQEVLTAQLPHLVQMDVSPLAGLLAEQLLAYTPHLDKAFFCNSGTEAVEAAIKFARYATGRPGILYCSDAFHGLSYGALSLSGDEQFRAGFGPLLPATREIPYNDLEALERALAPGDIAALFLEPIQGHTVLSLSDDYGREAARLCARHGTLLVADEIQTGCGRTGRFCAYEHWGLEPDMVLLAKVLSGGFIPAGAVLVRKPIFDKVFNRMDRAVVHGSTFSKNNLAMAAGLATLEVIRQEGLIEKAATRGNLLLEQLRALVPQFEFLHEVRGRGMMIGLCFGKPQSTARRAAWNVLEKASPGLFCQLITIPLFTEHRILSQVTGRGSHVVKFLPPLIISADDAEWILRATRAVIADAHRIPGAVWDLGRKLAAQAISRH